MQQLTNERIKEVWKNAIDRDLWDRCKLCSRALQGEYKAREGLLYDLNITNHFGFRVENITEEPLTDALILQMKNYAIEIEGDYELAEICRDALNPDHPNYNGARDQVAYEINLERKIQAYPNPIKVIP